MNEPTETGKIKFLKDDYGFITPDNGGPDVFVHSTVLARSRLMDIERGQAVRYAAFEKQNGKMAASVVELA